MKITVTTAAPDRRPAKPADLVALDSALTTATARTRIDQAAARILAVTGIGYEPWRQAYSLRLPGTGTTVLPLRHKPVEVIAAVTAVDGGAVTDYTVISNGAGIEDRLERQSGWGSLFEGSIGMSGVPDADSERDAWIVTGTIGWLMPGQVSTWVASTAYPTEVGSTSYDDPATGNAYPVGSWVRATDPRVLLRFECTTAGTSDATEPTAFLTADAADAITDGTATWTARSAHELPADFEKTALQWALAIYRTRTRDRELKSFSKAGANAEFGGKTTDAAFFDDLRAYR